MSDELKEKVELLVFIFTFTHFPILFRKNGDFEDETAFHDDACTHPPLEFIFIFVFLLVLFMLVFFGFDSEHFVDEGFIDVDIGYYFH